MYEPPKQILDLEADILAKELVSQALNRMKKWRVKLAVLIIIIKMHKFAKRVTKNMN